MGVTETRYEHVILSDDGTPVIGEAGMKVVELVARMMAYGWSDDELHFQHPGLSLGQIHSALAYCWDHTNELNADIERRLERADQIRQAAGEPPLITRLKAKGLLESDLATLGALSAQ